MGKAQANLQVGAKIYEMATGDPALSTTLIAAIFWAKCQMGWRAGAPVEPETEVPDFSSAGGQVVIMRLQNGK